MQANDAAAVFLPNGIPAPRGAEVKSRHQQVCFAIVPLAAIVVLKEPASKIKTAGNAAGSALHRDYCGLR